MNVIQDAVAHFDMFPMPAIVEGTAKKTSLDALIKKRHSKRIDRIAADSKSIKESIRIRPLIRIIVRIHDG